MRPILMKDKIMVPRYLERLNLEKIYNYPCINCLLDTENQIKEGNFDGFSEGDQIWYETFKAESEELKKVLLEYKPKEAIEIGSGTGRVIKIILDTLSDIWILGTELNPRMFNFVSKRFSKVPNVSVRSVDVSEFLDREEDYNMGICMMNTLSNINNPNLLKKIINRSDIFVFSLYNREFDNKRKKMYKARGHTDFKFLDGKCIFDDIWVKGLVSRSYTSEEIEKLVSSNGGSIVSLKKIGVLYFIVVKKA
jgi:SAM-dependent methyltransferase